MLCLAVASTAAFAQEASSSVASIHKNLLQEEIPDSLEIFNAPVVNESETAKQDTVAIQATAEEPSDSNSDANEEVAYDELDSSYFNFSNITIPVSYPTRLGSPYGLRDHRLHRGVDVKVQIGDPIAAAWSGKVVISKYNEGGYGHYVLIQHDNGIQTLYGHLSQRNVKVGETVKAGQTIGLGGNTGRSSGSHLHFEMRYGEVNIDPVTVIDFVNRELTEEAGHYSKKKAKKAHWAIQSKISRHKYYTVQAGDNLSSIAKYFNISVNALCRLNNIDAGTTLQIGQRLKGSN